MAGTNNIHWTLLSKTVTTGTATVGCTGIEYTELSEKSQNSISLRGTRESNAQCTGMDEYALASTDDPLVIQAVDKLGVQMKFEREEGQQCFTVHWKSGGYDYMGYLDKQILKGREHLVDHIFIEYQRQKLNWMDEMIFL